MAVTLTTLQQQVPELTVDVYKNRVFLVQYLPSKLSKPMLKRVQTLAEAEDWETKADSNPAFLVEIIPPFGWTLGVPDLELDPSGQTPKKGPDGKDLIMEVTEDNLSTLGFILMRDLARAINSSYTEFMKQGEETGVSSEEQSSATSNVISFGTQLSAPATEDTVVPGN